MIEGSAAGLMCDTRGLRCPMPVLMLRRFLKSVPGGTIVRVLSDDPQAPVEFEAYCQLSGDVLVDKSQKQGYDESVIEKAPIEAKQN